MVRRQLFSAKGDLRQPTCRQEEALNSVKQGKLLPTQAGLQGCGRTRMHRIQQGCACCNGWLWGMEMMEL